MRFIPSNEIPELFSQRIASRGPNEDALVATMALSLDDNEIMAALLRYGKKGDYLAVDNYGHSYGYTPRLTWRGIPSTHALIMDSYAKKFRGEYVVLNQPARKLPPFDALLGRSHIKIYSVGDRLISMGGVNCDPHSFKNNIDGMIDFKSAEFMTFVDRFIAWRGNLRRTAVGESFSIDKNAEAVIDYGRKGRSLILERLYKELAVPGITRIVYSSNYIPIGRLDNIFYELKEKGAEINVYANHPRKFLAKMHSNINIPTQFAVLALNRSGWQDNVPDRFNHLKVIVIEYKDRETVMFTGSHNFSPVPVAAGTSEVALRTTNQDLINQVVAYINSSLGGLQ